MPSEWNEVEVVLEVSVLSLKLQIKEMAEKEGRRWVEEEGDASASSRGGGLALF